MLIFDANFYREVLPQRVTMECRWRPGKVLVVNLHLANGKILDVCQFTHLADRWFAVQYFRDAETCDDRDLAFLPYELVVLVVISLHCPGKRRLGFCIAQTSAALHAGTGAIDSWARPSVRIGSQVYQRRPLPIHRHQ